MLIDFYKRSVNTEYGVVKYTTSSRGNVLLLLDNIGYTLNSKKRNTCYWECLKRRTRPFMCRSRIVTVDGMVKSVRGGHNHGSA